MGPNAVRYLRTASIVYDPVRRSSKDVEELRGVRGWIVGIVRVVGGSGRPLTSPPLQDSSSQTSRTPIEGEIGSRERNRVKIRESY